jgi:hypothetical protein
MGRGKVDLGQLRYAQGRSARPRGSARGPRHPPAAPAAPTTWTRPAFWN